MTAEWLALETLGDLRGELEAQDAASPPGRRVLLAWIEGTRGDGDSRERATVYRHAGGALASFASYADLEPAQDSPALPEAPGDDPVLLLSEPLAASALEALIAGSPWERRDRTTWLAIAGADARHADELATALGLDLRGCAASWRLYARAAEAPIRLTARGPDPGETADHADARGRWLGKLRTKED